MGSPLIGYVGGFEFHSDAYTTVTDEAVGHTSDSTYSVAHSDVDGTEATIKIGGTEIGDNYWKLHPNGTLTITASDAGDITATYDYANAVVAAGAFMNWSLDVDVDLHETTNFDTVGWKEQIAGLKSWTGSAERHWQDTKLSGNEGRKALCRFYKDDSTSSDYYVGWAIISGFGTEVDVNAIIDESLEFAGVGDLFSG